MAAQRYFHRRGGEPADVEIRRVRLWQRHQKRGFRQVVLQCYCLHPLVWQPLVQRHNGCRITAEQGVGKGIDLINRCGVHRFSLLELVR